MFVLIFLILGIIIGSFLNVCIYRIPRGESISFPPSHCTNCKNKIKSYDLIPILSYMILRGKCRFCGEKISIKYPLIELITGALFAALYIKYNLSFEVIKYASLISFLLVIGFIDLETTDVYFRTTLSGAIAGLIFIAFGYFYGYGINDFIFGGLAASGFIAIIILLTHGMGWGDAEICGLTGLFLGLKLTIVMVFLSFTLGGVIGIVLMLLKIKSRKDIIPFGPFISIGAILTIFIGNNILNWYMTFIK